VTTWLEFWHGHWQTYLNHGSAMAERIEWLAARASKTIVTISQHTTDGLVEAGVPNERITLIPPGIDWEALQAQEPDEAPVDLLFAGRLIRDKRVDLALQAVARVASIRPDIRCCIVGDGPERPQLEAMADDLGIRSNVRFLGFLDDSRDLYRLMRASKTFLFPSQREGFGIVVVEAAACGLPVIAIDAPNNAAAQLVRSGGFGFVCSADPNAIAEKVDILLSDHALRARLAAKGQEWSRQYDWQTVVEKQRALYERLCAGKRRSAR
jgi:glycosyltransferase involved in cell wall biosynthesis